MLHLIAPVLVTLAPAQDLSAATPTAPKGIAETPASTPRSFRLGPADSLDHATLGRPTFGPDAPSCIGHAVAPGLIMGGVDSTGTYLASYWIELDYPDVGWAAGTERLAPPPHRNAAAAVLETPDATDRAILFGGRFRSTIFDTTWSYDFGEQRWSQIEAVGPGPEGRIDHAMLGTTDGVLLFGGRVGSDLAAAQDGDDFWRFDGIGWERIDPTSDTPWPSPRSGHQLALDPRDGSILLHGGVRRLNKQNITLDDTWRWDGEGWHHLGSGRGPGGNSFGLGFSTELQGFIAMRDENTWLYRDATWSELPVAETTPRGLHPNAGAGFLDRGNFLEAIGGLGEHRNHQMLRTTRRASADCNGDGVEDFEQIAAGTLEDCNLNGVPDLCEDAATDCDDNGFIDECEVAPRYRRASGQNLTAWGAGDPKASPFTLWLVRHTVQPGGEIVDRIWWYVREGGVSPMSSIRFGIWRDDSGSGMPHDATLLYSSPPRLVGDATGWRVSEIEPTVLGAAGDTFFVGFEHEYFDTPNFAIPGCTSERVPQDGEDQWAALSPLPLDFTRLGDPPTNGAFTMQLAPWMTWNDGTTPLGQSFMIRAGREAPIDLDGDFVPDVCEPCLGDLSNDRRVDGVDLGIYLLFAGAACGPDTQNPDCVGDLDGDGLITGGDLGLLLVAWGDCL